MEETQNIETQAVELPAPHAPFVYFPFKSRSTATFLLFVIGFIYYINTVNNEAAFDDGVVIHQNSYVLQGNDGIPGIYAHDTYHSFYERMNATDQLAFGRYRPFTIMTYALEQQFIGTYQTGYYMWVRDLNNNNILDFDPVEYQEANGKWRSNYEYNDFEDLNGDGLVQPNECQSCWDANRNFANDINEDLNQDGVYNEVDCQVKGSGFRHFNSVWIYVILCIAIFLFLYKHIFKDNPDMAFLGALIFLIHPLNTESVAGLARRDEIFSLLFIIGCLFSSFNFIENKTNRSLAWASVYFLLALLSKEYSFMLLLILPVGAYVLRKIELQELSKVVWPFLIFIFSVMALVGLKFLTSGLQSVVYFYPSLIILVFYGVVSFFAFKGQIKERSFSSLMIFLFMSFLLYLAMRLNAVKITGTGPDYPEILNDPYAFATGEERFCTSITVLGYYIKLLFYPATLVCDHSFNSIPFKTFSDPEFLVSFVINLGLVITMIWLCIKRHVLGFALLCYLGFLFIVSNLIYNTSGMMSEHFIFHSTFGFAIIVSWLVFKSIEKLKLSLPMSKIGLISLLLILVVGSGFKVIERNKDWCNDVTLFLKDVDKSPNSVLILGNAGARWIDLADTKEITGVKILGPDSLRFNDYNGTLKISDEDLKKSGLKTKREVALHKGIAYLERAVALHGKYVNGYLNLGLANYKLGNHERSIYYWKIAEYFYPNNPYLQNYYQVAGNTYMELGKKHFENKEFKKALNAYLCRLAIDKRNTEALKGKAACYFNMGEMDKAKRTLNWCLLVDPNDVNAKEMMGTIK